MTRSSARGSAGAPATAQDLVEVGRGRSGRVDDPHVRESARGRDSGRDDRNRSRRKRDDLRLGVGGTKGALSLGSGSAQQSLRHPGSE